MSENVFACGSNMCSARFRDYGLFPEGNGSCAVLGGYRLVFNKRSKDGLGKANVEPQEVRKCGACCSNATEDMKSRSKGRR